MFDTTVRLRNNQGTGSGSVVADLGDVYEIETNHHVAGRRGTRNIIDIWQGGDVIASLESRTAQSWYESSKSKDVAILRVPKSQLGDKPLAVIPTAPPGYESKIKPGDKVYMIGCSDARWPRARCGNVLSIKGGLIYYDPKSIGGDSGSGVYHFSIPDQKWYCVGRTAWAIEARRGKWVGLAMSSDRVRAIRAGEVSTGWILPTGAKRLDEIESDDDSHRKSTNLKRSTSGKPVIKCSENELPRMACRLDLLRTQVPNKDGSEPKVLNVDAEETGLIFNRRPPMDDNGQPIHKPVPIKEGIGSGLFWVLIAIAGAVFVSTLALVWKFYSVILAFFGR